MAVKRKVYMPEFKLAAVKMIPQEKLLRRRGRPAAGRPGEPAARVEEGPRHKGIDAFPGTGHLTPLVAENRRLRAENS